MEQKHIDRFKELSNLQPGWIENCPVPSKTSLELMMSIFERLLVDMPQTKFFIFPIIDGGVSVEFTSVIEHKFVEGDLSIRNDGSFNWYVSSALHREVDIESANTDSFESAIAFMIQHWNDLQKSFSVTIS